MTFIQIKETVTCSLNGAETTSLKLVQNYDLIQFISQTQLISPSRNTRASY